MMLKIGYLCHSSLGGSARVATELALIMAKQGHRVWIFCRTPPITLTEQHPNLTVSSLFPQLERHHNHGTLNTQWTEHEMTRYCHMICQQVRQQRLDILHFHYALPFVYIAQQIRTLLGRQAPAMVGTLHGTDVTQCADQPQLAAQMGECLGKTADVLTTVSDAHAQLALDLLPGITHPVVIPNFINQHRFKPCQRLPRRSTQTIVHISNYRAIKQPLEMAKIFLGLRAQLEVKLQLIGSGPELQSTLQFLQQNGAGDAVEVLGMQLDIAEILGQADLLLLSSAYESFCLSALEATACGIPVLAPRVGGLPEVVIEGKTGLLYSPGCINEAIEQAITLLSMPTHQRHFRQQIHHHADAFSEDLIVPRYVDIYQQLVMFDSTEVA